jgi:hypothetical protein
MMVDAVITATGCEVDHHVWVERYRIDLVESIFIADNLLGKIIDV